LLRPSLFELHLIPTTFFGEHRQIGSRQGCENHSTFGVDPALQLRRLRKVRITQRMESGLVQRGQGSHRAGEVTSVLQKVDLEVWRQKNPYIT
jgi:hypothetical protein